MQGRPVPGEGTGRPSCLWNTRPVSSRLHSHRKSCGGRLASQEALLPCHRLALRLEEGELGARNKENRKCAEPVMVASQKERITAHSVALPELSASGSHRGD